MGELVILPPDIFHKPEPAVLCLYILHGDTIILKFVNMFLRADLYDLINVTPQYLRILKTAADISQKSGLITLK